MSSGKIATPPQPIGSPQPTNVRPATEGGAAKPSHHTGKPVPSTPSRSRTTPSVTSAATPRLAIRAHRMSPKMPASVTPMASTTAMQPSGMASIAVRVEIGDDQDSGVARSSRARTKRSVKADTTSRFCPGRSGREPRIQTFLSPFLRRTVVIVAVDTPERVLIASGVRDIERGTPAMDDRAGVSCGARSSRQVVRQPTTEGAATQSRRQALREANSTSLENKLVSWVMAAKLSPPRILPSGDSAITVEFSRNIDDAANQRVLALDRALADRPVSGVTETVPTYRSLLVHYDPVQIDFDALSAKLVALAKLPVPPVTRTRRWRIPVAYGGENGIDLEDAAKM